MGKKLSTTHKENIRLGNLNNPQKKYCNTSIEKKIKAELIKRQLLFKQNINIENIANVDFFLPEY